MPTTSAGRFHARFSLSPEARRRYLTGSVGQRAKVGLMPDFQLEAPFQPTGDQPQAIDKLVDGLGRGKKQQVLLGVTGSGKSYTMASVIEKHQRPTLILAHNKTLAAQLYSEMREFFPNN